MNLAYRAYQSISSGLFLALFPPFWIYSRVTGRYRNSLRQRLGIYDDPLVRAIPKTPRIWIHAVSVGEVRAAVSILNALSEMVPGCGLVLSTGTEQGQAVARESVQSEVTCLYAPLDFILSTRRALRTVRPHVLVCVETEIWPNWLMEAHRQGIRTALVNGRISVRSIERYLKIRPLMRETLSHVSAFSMIGKADAERIRMMGAAEERIEINGNAKYDMLMGQTDPDHKRKMSRRFDLNGDQPVFVAGSIRSGEEKIVLDVYQDILRSVPETVLIIAPRHVRRVRPIEAQARARGWACQLRTELAARGARRTAPVVILDTMGELPATYSIATVVFCGGSLVPLGGQNILEAAVWGKPVLYGPSMEDFMDAKLLLDQTGGGVQVRDGRDLAAKAVYYLRHPDEARRISRFAQQAVIAHIGAARKHAHVVFRLLPPTPLRR